MLSHLIRRTIICTIFIQMSLIPVFSQEVGEIIPLTQEQDSIILKLLSDYHGNKGKCSNLTINKAYLKFFIESADYGPMWYGDTIIVEKQGILIRYEFNISDSTTNKANRSLQHTKDWHSNENLFVPLDRSSLYVKYTCRFGGFPPSHGYANRRRDYKEIMDSIIFTLGNN